MQAVIDFILELAREWGYLGIIALMTLESCFIPFPSEVVMIPAGYLAFKGEMNLYLSIFCGTLGSILGALINYYLCFFWGRAAVLRWGKYVGLSEQKFAKFEAFFNKHGEFSTFICRLLPGIRQYISMPAGLARMKIFAFVLYTGLGSFIWVSILAALGFVVGQNEALIRLYLNEILIGIFIFALLATLVYVWIKRRKS